MRAHRRLGKLVLFVGFGGCLLGLMALWVHDNAARGQEPTKKKAAKTVELKSTQQTPPIPAPPTTASTPIVHVIDETVAFAARFNFKIDPNTPLKDLLPTPPKSTNAGAPYLGDDLSKVPEISFQSPLAGSPKALEETAHTIAKINHLNQKKTDAFMQALIAERPDLAGMPFMMGDACRMKPSRSAAFTSSLTRLRQNMNQQLSLSVADAQQAPQRAADTFWSQFHTQAVQEDRARANEDMTCARISALMQVLGPESAAMRTGLVKYLASVSHVEATKALARLAIFSFEEEVAGAAIEALKTRREKDYTEILQQGLRYPLPAVAQRAAAAIAKLQRTDMIAELVAFLDEVDPRAPVTKAIDNRPVSAVREVVRINHHRNCVLCHAPEQQNRQAGGGVVFQNIQAVPPPPPVTFSLPGGTVPTTRQAGFRGVMPAQITAQVPVPGQPLPTPSQGYDNSIPDILVRIDTTYLRQDFSLLQKVADAQPWPEMQRFDFLVRTRKLTSEEAQACRDELKKSETAGQTPYRQATLLALRTLTGRDGAPTTAAWRKVLDLR